MTTLIVFCQDGCLNAKGEPTSCRTRAAKDGTPKTPLRWRKTANGFRCPKCQAAQFVPRSIRLRLVGPVEGDGRDKAAMYAALYAASRESNQFANWYLQRLLAADVALVQAIPQLPAGANGKPAMPPMPQVDWYGEATQLFPSVAPSSLVQQARMVARYYGKERFAALVAMVRNVRSYVWDGLPVVVNAQAWKLLRMEDDAIVLRAQIGPGKSWTLKVFAQGENLARMRQIADGQLVAGTAVFVRRAREQRPGETKRVRVWYLRISAQVPRATAKARTATSLTLGYDAENLLFGVVDAESESIDAPTLEYPAPSLRSLIAAHKKLDRQRQIENSIRARHWSKRKAQRWSVGRTAACQRNNNKIKAELALCAAWLTERCQSLGIAEVNFDVTPRGWMEKFPYAALQQRIQTSLENAGVALRLSGSNSLGDEVHLGETEQPAFAGPKCETGVSA